LSEKIWFPPKNTIFEYYKINTMKNLILSAALTIACSISVMAQNDAPESVKTAFQQSMPGVTAKYVQEGNTWKAGFAEKAQTTYLVYDEKGTLLYTETMLTKAQAPAQAVKDNEARFTDYTFENVSKVEYPDGTSLYQFQYMMKGSTQHLEVFYNDNGVLVKRNLF
jgi:hypothetical protein